jgi:para-nitrobenzyl esterase
MTAVGAQAPAAWGQAPGSGRVVQTADGAVRGTQGYGLRLFQGIPYAAAPVGERRFRAPQRVEPWSGVRDATRPGSQCAQLNRGRNPESFGEDCLYLNVTTPAGGNARRGDLPVMVWIHGGSFVFGTGANYDASQLALQGDAVVVTINYRLGPLGFLAHPALSAEAGADGSGNLALQDQQAALRWVRENAAAFGGDPSRVTVFGESAGAASVCANLVSPASSGLFSRAIAQSYSCAQDLATRERAEAAGVAFAARVGCTDAATAAACLRGKGAEELLRAWSGGAFVVGGPLLPLQPRRALETGNHAQVPFMHGNNRDENTLFAPLGYGTAITSERYAEIIRTLYGANADEVLARYPASAYPSPIAALSRVQSDAPGALGTCTHVLAYELASARRSSARVFAYQFRDRTAPPYVDFPGLEEGAQHATELSYLFPRLLGAGLTREQERLSFAMVEYWTNFARRGTPNAAGLPTWPRYREPRDVLGLALPEQGGIRPVDVAAESQCDFWNDLGL